MTGDHDSHDGERRPRFRRASQPVAFRLTDGDLVIIQHLARYRFLRSTHIAALVGRSIDRINDRLLRLFHAGYVDRPKAQLDYYPTAGSAPMVYAVADRGARLLAEHTGSRLATLEWSRKNREAGRPFIEHQLEIMDFQVALEIAVRDRADVTLIRTDELAAAMPQAVTDGKHPFSMPAVVAHGGKKYTVSVTPDFVFGLRFRDGSRRCFMVEIDRGTMPISRSDLQQTSFARKMRAYLAAHTSKEQERLFGWKTFRVLTVTTDVQRAQSMQAALQQLHAGPGPGAALFLFATRELLRHSDPLTLEWSDGKGRASCIV
jgi:Replication-relaxation